MYSLDRSVFKVQTFEEATKTKAYWLKQPPAERLRAAWFLTCAAFNIDYNKPPRLDRTVFSMRKNGKHTQ
jgi:hypothetical protein